MFEETSESSTSLNSLRTDKKFWSLFHKSVFANAKPSASKLLESFVHNYGPTQFFESFDNREAAINVYQTYFGTHAIQQIVERANCICNGKFDLLGFSKLDFGSPIDWLLNPISQKQFLSNNVAEPDGKSNAETVDQRIVWELNRHQHFFFLGVAYWLTGNEKFAVTFNMHLSGWIDQNPPGNSVNWINNQETAFRMISWLWALHFFKTSPNLSPTIFTDIVKLLYQQAKHVETTLFSANNSPLGLIVEALGLFYVGTLLPQFQAAKKWRMIGVEILLSELERQIQSDGVHVTQTTWCQRYVIDVYTHFLLLSRLNSSVSESPDHSKVEAKLQQALDFLMYLTRPDGTMPMIGENDGGRLLPFGNSAVNDFRAALSAGAILFDRGDYKFVAGEAPEEIFWLLNIKSLKKFAAIKAHAPAEFSKEFAKSGYFVMRDGWTEKNNYLLLDGGKHTLRNDKDVHNDALAFELAVAGRTTLIDPGASDSFSSVDAQQYFRSAAAHNTLTISGKSEHLENKFSWATIAKEHQEQAVNHRFFDFFQATHHNFLFTAENDSEKETFAFAHTRKFLFLRHNYWILVDTGVAVGKHNYELKFHFDPGSKPEIVSNKENSFVYNPPLENQINGLKIFTFCADGEWDIISDWTAPYYGLYIPSLTASFSSEAFNQQKFVTFMLPSSSINDSIVAQEFAARGGRSFKIKFNKNLDWFIYGDDKIVTANNNAFVSNFRFAWARFDKNEKTIEEIVLLDGNHFIWNNVEIYSSPDSKRYVVGRKIKDELIFEMG
jgi:hypothetical protein